MSLILDANDERIRIQLGWTYAIKAVVGDCIAMRGCGFVSACGEVVLRGDITAVLGHGPPPEPERIPLPLLRVASHNNHIIRTEGTVADVVQDSVDAHYSFLILRDGSSQIPVAIRNTSPCLSRPLDGCRIRLKGCYLKAIDGGRRFCGPCIELLDDDIDVLEPAAEDPFRAEPLDESMLRATEEVFSAAPRTVCGTVLATWRAKDFMLRSDRNRIIIVHLAKGAVLPSPGNRVCVVGLPGTDLFTLTVNHARCKVIESVASANESPVDLTAEQILCNASGYREIHPQFYGKLARIRGVFTGQVGDRNERQTRLVCGKLELNVDFTSCPGAFDEIAPESTVEIVGYIRLDTRPWSPFDIFPDIDGVSIIPRSPVDVTVVRRPPWWTPRRFAAVILVLLALLGAIIIKNSLDRKFARLKLDERTRLAIELHDSLSQALAGITCQLAVDSDAVRRDPALLVSRIRVAEKMLDSCRAELKNCLFDLRSNTLGENDFSKAVQMTLAGLSNEVTLRLRTAAVVRSKMDDATVHATLAIIRELVSNAIRHGMAATVFVGASCEKNILLVSVRDDGCGFNPDTSAGIDEGHFGLNGIRERLLKLHGSLQIHSTPGKGTRVRFTIPLG